MNVEEAIAQINIYYYKKVKNYIVLYDEEIKRLNDENNKLRNKIAQLHEMNDGYVSTIRRLRGIK